MKMVVLTALLGCAACGFSPASDRDVRLARLASEHKALVAQLDDLQARLLVGAERVRFWEEMRGRHESVSAIACTTQEAHAVAMAQFLERQEGTRRTASAAPPKLRHARVASVRSAADATPAAVRRR